MTASPLSPRSTSEWLIWGWALGGVFLFIGNAVFRLGPRGLEIFNGLSTLQLVLAVAWTAFMLYGEGYRGFHLRFAPRVVARAGALARQQPHPGLVALGPFVAMGLLHGTPRRLLASRALLAMIVVMVFLVRWLPEPWRAIVDFGVVAGLVAGLASMLYFAWGTVAGAPPDVDPEFPANFPTIEGQSAAKAGDYGPKSEE